MTSSVRAVRDRPRQARGPAAKLDDFDTRPIVRLRRQSMQRPQLRPPYWRLLPIAVDELPVPEKNPCDVAHDLDTDQPVNPDILCAPLWHFQSSFGSLVVGKSGSRPFPSRRTNLKHLFDRVATEPLVQRDKLVTYVAEISLRIPVLFVSSQERMLT